MEDFEARCKGCRASALVCVALGNGCDLRDGKFRVRENCGLSRKRSRRHSCWPASVLGTRVGGAVPGRITGVATGIKSPGFRAQAIDSSGDFFGENIFGFLEGLAAARAGVFEGFFAGQKSPDRRSQVIDSSKEFTSKKFFAFWGAMLTRATVPHRLALLGTSPVKG